MEWVDYYDKVFDWSESTRVRRISDLTDIGSPDEIVDAAQAFDEDKNASKLIKKALNLGVCFTPENVIDLIMVVDDSTLTQMVKAAKGRFTKDQLDEIYMIIDDSVYESLESHLPESQRNMGPGAFDVMVSAIKEIADMDLSSLNTHSTYKPAPKQGRKRSTKTQWKKLFASMRSLNRTTKKFLAGPPTTKEKIARQRAKARRNRPWWDK